MTPAARLGALLLPLLALPAEARGAAPAAPVAAAAPEADDGIARLRFAWPTPARARVSYRRTRTGGGRKASTFTARYETRVERGEGDLRVSTHATSWRGDLPFPRALTREAIRASEAVVQRVGAEGEFAGLDGVEAMRPVLARVFEAAKVPPEAAERALPLAEATMRAEAEELWNLAVGFWTGADLKVGERYLLSSEGEIPLLPGVRAAQAVEFGVRRRVPCSASERALRCVEATLRSTPDRAALERAADALLPRLLPGAAERPAAAAQDLSAESELVLVTDPATLLPRRLVWTKAVRLGGGERGPPAAELVDRTEYDYRYLPSAPPPRAPRRRAPAVPARGSPAPAARAPVAG